jgi:hypothetical protein
MKNFNFKAHSWAIQNTLSGRNFHQKASCHPGGQRERFKKIRMRLFGYLSQQSINLNAFGDKKSTMWNNNSKNNTSTLKMVAKKKTGGGVFEFLRNNKIASFVIILAACNLVRLFEPLHKRRPEILARNRLAPKT